MIYATIRDPELDVRLGCAVKWLAGMLRAEDGFRLAYAAFNTADKTNPPPPGIIDATEGSLQAVTGNIKNFCAMFDEKCGPGTGDTMRTNAMKLLHALAEKEAPKK